MTFTEVIIGHYKDEKLVKEERRNLDPGTGKLDKAVDYKAGTMVLFAFPATKQLRVAPSILNPIKSDICPTLYPKEIQGFWNTWAP